MPLWSTPLDTVACDVIFFFNSDGFGAYSRADSKRTLNILVKEETMSKDFCMDCGMLLSPHTSVCHVCGYDNNYDEFYDIMLGIDPIDDVEGGCILEHYPG